MDSTITILLADDDPDDREMTIEALEEAKISGNLKWTRDGEELMDYLRQRGKYATPGAAPRPALILLDLNMPRKDGREALEEIKSDPDLRGIPVVIFTTSRRYEDMQQSYQSGANSFVSKPVSFDGLVKAMQTFTLYWTKVAELPATRES